MAKRFRFNLQPVLEQRQRLEDACTQRVAALERERLEAEQRLRQRQDQIGQAAMDLREQLGGVVDLATGESSSRGAVNVTMVRMQAGASLHLAARARQDALELAGAYKRVEMARQELVRASTAKKAVEKLKERRAAEFQANQRRTENLQLDELLTQRSARKEVH